MSFSLGSYALSMENLIEKNSEDAIKSINKISGNKYNLTFFIGRNKREFKLNIKAEMEKIKNECEEISIKSIDYSKSLESTYGYFECYYLEAPIIRQTKFTITEGRLDGTQMSHSRNVDSSLPEQSWEDKAELFLGQLINSGRLDEEVASNIHSLSR